MIVLRTYPWILFCGLCSCCREKGLGSSSWTSVPKCAGKWRAEPPALLLADISRWLRLNQDSCFLALQDLGLVFIAMSWRSELARWDCRRGGWRESLFYSTTTIKTAVLRMLVTFLRWQMSGCEEMGSWCARESLDWISGIISSQRGWSSIGIGFPGKRWSLHPWKY